MSDGLRRAWAVARAAWAEDRKRPRISRNRDETDFLPAAVEIQERPASPAGRVFAVLIAALMVSVLAWGWFGEIDTVAVAQGRIIPGGRVKVIQPLEIGVVRAIHVRDGQAVAKDDVLIELDPTESVADRTRLEKDLMAMRLDAARLAAMAKRPGDPLAVFQPPARVESAGLAVARALMRAEAAEYREALAGIGAEKRQREAEVATMSTRIASIRKTIPLVRQRVEAFSHLVSKEYASRLRLTELTEELISREHALTIEQRRTVEIREAMKVLDRRRAQHVATVAGRVVRDLAQAMRAAARLEQDLAKTRERLRARHLHAPVDGVVQQLAVHTLGGVVSPAEPLMVLVPAGAALEIEAMALNKDIGFVRSGQPVEIKIDSFPFTRYGLIDGEVVQVSADSVADERRGLVYPMRVAMNRSRMLVGDRWVSLTPGMSVTVEVKTGKRRALDFFLSPFLRYQDEAMRER